MSELALTPPCIKCEVWISPHTTTVHQVQSLIGPHTTTVHEVPGLDWPITP